MIRQKQIEKAASTPESYGLNSGDSFRGVPKGIQETFIQGAEWADANAPAPSASDERDANVYATDARAAGWTDSGSMWANVRNAFLAGRKGTVPRFAQDDNYKRGYAEAIKAERERIRNEIEPLTKRSNYPWNERGEYTKEEFGFEWQIKSYCHVLDLILNPSEEGK